MSTTRDDAEAAPSRAVPLDDRSFVSTIMGLRWWATLLIALVLTVVGVAADILRAGQLGLIYTVCFPVGCVLAIVWARRSEMFGPMVQPPLLLAVTVPLVVVATGSLPRSRGLASTAIAVGGPLINGFPAMAITTAIVLAIGFVRWKLQPTSRSARPDAARDQSRPARPSAAPEGRGAIGRPPAEKRGPRSSAQDDRDGRAPGVYPVGRGGEAERMDRTRRPGPPQR